MMPFSIITKRANNNNKRSVDLKVRYNEYQYPFDLAELTNAYLSNPYHKQCIDIKTMNILGDGLSDDISDELEDCTPADSTVNILIKTIKDLETYGNAFWEIVSLGKTGYQIFHIPAQTMAVSEKGFKQTVNGKVVEFSKEQVFHFKYFSPVSTVYGAPDYLPVLKSIALFEKIIAYNDNFFSNNAIPDMALIVEGGEMTDAARYQVQRFFRDKFSGTENAHKCLYLPVKDGMKVSFQKLQADQKDASFMELMKQTVNDIIACHGVPPRLISIVNQSQLGGGGETSGQMDIFMKTVILPKQRIITGMLEELAKKYPNMFKSDNFDFIPLAYTEEPNPLNSLLRRV
ncbi:MAG: phage portal protein [Thiohalomonadaceae bacterium]